MAFHCHQAHDQHTPVVSFSSKSLLAIKMADALPAPPPAAVKQATKKKCDMNVSKQLLAELQSLLAFMPVMTLRPFAEAALQ